ncbi:MAG: hypothetical protein AAFY42_09725 [Pseudomonadota bacterium]
MALDKTSELKENFLFFQRTMSSFIDDHRGKYALLHSRKIIGFFDRAIEAAEAGASQYPDGRFSVQKVTDRPADL